MPASGTRIDGSVHGRSEDDAGVVLEDVDQSALRVLVVHDEEEIVVIRQVVRIASALQILKSRSAGFRRLADEVLRERDSGLYEAFHSSPGLRNDTTLRFRHSVVRSEPS